MAHFLMNIYIDNVPWYIVNIPWYNSYEPVLGIYYVLLGRDIDAIAREPLWALGLDYQHGTGHGIGMFLHVHEGPARINIGYRETEYESPLYRGMILSDGRRRCL